MYICNSLVFALSRHNCGKKKAHTRRAGRRQDTSFCFCRVFLSRLWKLCLMILTRFFFPFNLLSLARPSLLGCFTSLLPFPLLFVSAVLKSLLEVKNDLLILLYK